MNRAGARPAGHIAIILHDFPAGGTERIAIRLAGAWAAAGRRVTIFCGAAEGPLRAMVPASVAVVEMQPPIRRGPGSRLRFGRKVAAVIDAAEPDILFVPGNFHLMVLRAMRGRLRHRPPTVMKISNPLSDPDRLLPRAVSRGAVGLVAADVDVFVAMSPALAAEARKELPSARIAVIAEPNLDGRDPLPSRPEGADLMVAAGRFVPQKDFGLLVRAVATLAADAPRVVLLGEGPERPRIERLIRRLRLDDRVECAGLVADIRPWLDRARLFLLPSRYEGFPAVVVEALARGVPVVATDCSPALHELITGPDFGEIVRGRSPEAFAAAVARQLARPRPAPEKLMAQVAGNRLDASAAAYLRLFDTLSAAAMPMVAAERVAA